MRVDIIGQKFGLLTVGQFARKEKRRLYYVCSCECGQSITTSSWALLRGIITSCGCAPHVSAESALVIDPHQARFSLALKHAQLLAAMRQVTYLLAYQARPPLVYTAPRCLAPFSRKTADHHTLAYVQVDGSITWAPTIQRGDV